MAHERRISEVHLPHADYDWTDRSVPIWVAASRKEPLRVKPGDNAAWNHSILLAPGEEACFMIDLVYEENEDGSPGGPGNNQFRIWKRVSSQQENDNG